MRLTFFLAAFFLTVSAFHTDGCRAERIKIVKVERSPQFEWARVRIVSLKNDHVFFSLTPEIKLEVTGYELGVQTPFGRKKQIANSAEGQHVHVIVDNKPYKAVYDVSKPIPLEGLGIGPHTLAVFPSRSYHESVKSEDASHIVNFSILPSFGRPPPLSLFSPGVVYSRPKGVYKGRDAERIMVDFYLHETVLGEDGYTVQLSIFEGTDIYSNPPVATAVFNQWRPAFVEGLESGKYTFRIKLIHPSGRTMPGEFGVADRVVTVVR